MFAPATSRPGLPAACVIRGRGAGARAARASRHRAGRGLGSATPRAAPTSSRPGTGRNALLTSCPHVPRTAASEETRQTGSCLRWSAASRSSSESACAAKRTSSGPKARSTPAPSKTTTPRRPAIATKLASASVSSSRSRETSGVEQVRAVEEVERRVRHAQPPVEVRLVRCRRASKRRSAAATLTLSDSTPARAGSTTDASQRAPHERPHAPAFGAEDERHAAGQIGSQSVVSPSPAAA